MKKIGIAAVLLFLFGTSVAQECTTIDSGTLLAADGSPIELGYDSWGYNYQAHMFNGLYCDAYRDAAWCQPYADIELMMKWNDAWISNRDCNSDALLDRHFGYATYIGSGAWLTNHQSGWVVDDKGKKRKWTYMIKIVAAEADDYKEDGTWYSTDGLEKGPDIWGQFIIVQEVSNDPSAGQHGILYKSPMDPGLGNLN